PRCSRTNKRSDPSWALVTKSGLTIPKVRPITGLNWMPASMTQRSSRASRAGRKRVVGLEARAARLSAGPAFLAAGLGRGDRRGWRSAKRFLAMGVAPFPALGRRVEDHESVLTVANARVRQAFATPIRKRLRPRVWSPDARSAIHGTRA